MTLHFMFMTNFNVFFLRDDGKTFIKCIFVLRTLYFSKFRIESFHEIEVFVQSRVLLKDLATVFTHC